MSGRVVGRNDPNPIVEPWVKYTVTWELQSRQPLLDGGHTPWLDEFVARRSFPTYDEAMRAKAEEIPALAARVYRSSRVEIRWVKVRIDRHVQTLLYTNYDKGSR